jgi:membrane fusion protein, multidrug efflux system
MFLTKKVLGILFISLIIIVSYGCSETEETEKVVNKVSVETIELVGEHYIDYISVVGTVKPFQKALISTTEGGKIVKLYKDKGDFVRKGEKILEIDNDILSSNLQATKAQYDLAKITYEKQKMIFDQNVNSEIQFLQSKYSMEQAEANHKLVKTRYNNTFIIAPFSGYIDYKYFDLNELAPVGQPIIQLIDVSKVKIEAGVPEKYISSVHLGDMANISLKQLNIQLNGKISFVGTSVNTNNRTFPIEIILENKGKELKPELITEVKIENEAFDDIIVVPNEVISRVDNGYVVYVVKNGIAYGMSLEILRRTSNKVAVAKGLKSGDSLVVVGYQNLVDGQAVNVVK